MRFVSRLALALAVQIGLPVACFAAIIGGAYYSPAYDYRDFFAATDGKPFQVVLAGTAFPGIDPALPIELQYSGQILPPSFTDHNVTHAHRIP